jgi:N-glycosylase/DNA lyase
MFHYPNIRWARMQAESMGMEYRHHQTAGEKESELKDLSAAIRPLKNDIDAIAAGGLASAYQADRITKIANSMNLKPIVPFWHMEIEKYWRMIMEAGFEVILTGVAADGLGKQWLGKRIDSKSFEELKRLSEKHKFHLGGEGGEYESMVLDGPIFRKKLIPLEAEISWDSSNSSGFYIIKEMMQIDKAELKRLLSDFESRRDKIKARLMEFGHLGKTATEERLFMELAFCLCTPQSKAKSCWAAVSGLEGMGLLLNGKKKDIESNLHGVRFHRNKAGYIEEARKTMSKSRLDVRSSVVGSTNSEKREWLVKNIKGLGYKEASHFLRNIGMGQGIAILDRHILKNLKRLGVIEAVPKTLTKKTYIDIEKRMSVFCTNIGISEEELDLLLWSKETGEIFK